MKRRKPVQERSRRRVETIIRAAAQIIARDGYAGLSTNRLAREAGVPVGSIYEYFENKDDILVAVIEHEIEAVMRRLQDEVQDVLASPDEEGLRRFLRFLLTEVTAHAELLRLIAGQIHGQSDVPAVSRFFAQAELLVRFLLQQMAADIVEDLSLDAYLVTHGLAGVCIGIANGLPPGKDIDDVVERLLTGIRTVVPSLRRR